MQLIFGLAELTVGAILLAAGVSGATLKDVVGGKTLAAYKHQEQNAGADLTSSSSSGGGSTIVTAKGGGKLNGNQAAFAKELARNTGLSLAVVQGWVLSEEPANASQAPNGANNWLNIGDTGSGNYAGGDSVWNNPISAADATAKWLAGVPLPGYGSASPGIQSILNSAGGSVSDQVRAIQNSGWAGSGYPNLPSVVSEFL